ncbi:MAG: phosphate transport system regulatory protein [Actinomycetota bacterium]|jgi:phosphate transport system protein
MEELRKTYHNTLDQIRADVILLAARVAESVPRAAGIILDSDLEGAEYVIKADAEIDAVAVELEERCIEVLALQAPVAGDLRQVLALMKIVAEIERTGDMVANICKVARRVYGHELDPRLRGLVGRMGEQAQAILLAAIDAMRERDVAKAAAVDDMDGYLDAVQKQFIQTLIETHHGTSDDMQVAVQLAMASRFFERIGDHGVNMAERVKFIVTGVLPDHRKPERAPVALGDVAHPEAGESA